MRDPQEPHFLAFKRILRQVRGKLAYGLQLYSSSSLSLVAYLDADRVGFPTTRRSSLGYYVFLGNNLLSWSFKHQLTLSWSSVEAEYRVVAETCWLRNLLRAIPSKIAANAKVAIQKMAEYSQKWHNETSKTRSVETSDGLATIQAQLNSLGREIKKVNEKVYAAQVGCKQCKGPQYTKYSPLKAEGASVSVIPFSTYLSFGLALLMQAKEKGDVLDAEAKAFLADVECTAPYDQPLALMTTNLFEANHEDAYDSDVDEGPHTSAAFMANLSSIGGTNGSSSSHINEAVPTVVSADEADKQSMIAVLQRMHTEIAGYVRVNDEHKLVNVTLTAKLERCKIEMQALKHNKVLSEKKTIEDKYLEEIVVLTNANKVATNVLKGLGYSNPSYSKQARITQHALYDGHVLLNPNHPPTRAHDSKESLVHAEVCKIKMAERPGHALPINYAKLNALYEQFVPQKELS
nr:ribonuclease H-like domain-containing protein [Tanacetum cinerariifolium]